MKVSCAELDALVEIALSCPGVLGSRMTGGGFGGCTITLVETAHVDSLLSMLEQEYTVKTGQHCVSYIVTPSAGAGQLSLS